MSRRFLFLLLTGLLPLAASCRKAPPVEAAFKDLTLKNEIYLLDDKPFTGIARAVHTDGTPSGEYPCRKGLLHGVVREWWDNGRQSTETHFANGKRHGSNKYWNREGRLTKEQIYDQGRSVSEQRF